MAVAETWSREEVEATVADYFHMLTMELAGQSFNKAEHNRRLQSKLDGRSKQSIEFKHRNISAVMVELGCPYITGYRPASNYQTLLVKVVEDRVAGDPLFDRAALSAVEQPAVAPAGIDFKGLVVPTPVPDRVREQRAPIYGRRGVFRDYLGREAANRTLGAAGEVWVVDYERHRLWEAGEKRLSERVEHVSQTRGDGLGYDVLSFDEDGGERFIEVKTTSFGELTPFYISRNEVEFSELQRKRFHLYRVFGFRRQPRMFQIQGAVRATCDLDPVSYLARLASRE